MSDKRFQKKLKRIEKKGERQKAKQKLIDKYAKYYPGKQRKVSNIMLVVVVAAVVSYTIAGFVLQYITGTEISSTLTTCWFTFFGTEIVALTGIKVSKVFRPPTEDNVSMDNIEDEDREGDCESEEV